MNVLRNNKSLKQVESEFVKSYSPTFAWGNAIGAYLMLPYLTAFWPMSAVLNGGHAADLSGQGLTLTNNNAVYFGTYGLAPYADLIAASSKYLSRADEGPLDITSGITIGGWFKPDSVAAQSLLITKGAGSPADTAYWLDINAGGVTRFLIGDGAAFTQADTPSGTLTTAGWYFIVGRFIASTSVALFVNGSSWQNTTAVPAAMVNSASPLNVGSYAGGAGAFFDGQVSLCFMCSMGLPDGTIQALYQSTRALFGT